MKTLKSFQIRRRFARTKSNESIMEGWTNQEKVEIVDHLRTGFPVPTMSLQLRGKSLVSNSSLS